MKTNPVPPRIPNPYRRISRITAGRGVLCLGLVFVPSFADMDMMDAGFGLAMLAGVGALAFFITAVVYGVLAGKLDALFAGEDLIGCWRMDAARWREFVSREYTAEYLEKKALWILMALITPFAALVFFCFILKPDSCGPSVFLPLCWLCSGSTNKYENKIHCHSVGVERYGAFTAVFDS